MKTFQEISALFEQYLKASLPFPDDRENLYEPCRYLLEAGGKRIRPALCLLAGDLFDNINDDSYHAGMAVELFHNFTLIHDDIMDKAPLRRGKPTIHAKYGLTTGILSGDIMGIFAYQCLSKVKERHLKEVFTIFNKTAIEVCEGQQMDMDFETQEQVTIAEYLQMIEFKTSVLLAASLQIGAIVAGAAPQDAWHLYEFGKNMGIAFQLQDDYLDTFGTEELIGKKPGGDIRSNKKTFLMLKLKELVENNGEVSVIESALTKNDEEKFEEVRQLYTSLNVDGYSREIINQYSDYSFEHLDKVAIAEEKKQPLRELASWLLNRQY